MYPSALTFFDKFQIERPRSQPFAGGSARGHRLGREPAAPLTKKQRSESQRTGADVGFEGGKSLH